MKNLKVTKTGPNMYVETIKNTFKTMGQTALVGSIPVLIKLGSQYLMPTPQRTPIPLQTMQKTNTQTSSNLQSQPSQVNPADVNPQFHGLMF